MLIFNGKIMADIMKELQEMMKHSLQTTEEMKRTTEEMKKDTVEMKKQMKEVQKELGGIGNSQEEVGIDLFRRNMKGILRKKGIMVDDIRTRFQNSIRLENGKMLDGEYDLMGINGKDIVVVEVKNKLRNDDITKFLEKQLPNFKTLFPQYKDYNLYGGVGSLVVGEHQEQIAEKKGLFVFTQGEDGNAMLMNSDKFKAKIF